MHTTISTLPDIVCLPTLNIAMLAQSTFVKVSLIGSVCTTTDRIDPARASRSSPGIVSGTVPQALVKKKKGKIRKKIQFV